MNVTQRGAGTIPEGASFPWCRGRIAVANLQREPHPRALDSPLRTPQLPIRASDTRASNSPQAVADMAAMMPSASTADPYDHDALERDDLIDPDDGKLPPRPCSIAGKLPGGLLMNAHLQPCLGRDSRRTYSERCLYVRC